MKASKRFFGVGLIVLAVVPWVCLLFVHRLPISNWWKAGIYSGLLVSSEVLNALGCAILGIDIAISIFRRRKTAKNVTKGSPPHKDEP